MSQNKRKIFRIFFLFFTGIYFLIKLNSGGLTSFLYQSGKIDLLNKITGAASVQTLDFYEGRAEETVWGPLGEVISGLLFTIFSLLYLKKSSVKIFGLAVFLYLIATRPEALFFPPYGDAIGGPFAEGLWLAHHSFDYAGLFYQPGYAMGGPKTYFTSIYPTFLAILLKFIPSAKIFLFVNHIIVFAFAATIIAVFREMLLRVFSVAVAMLGAILLLSLPLFLSQTEAINMEMPSVFFSMLSVFYLVKRQMPKAVILAMIASLVKETSVVSCLAVFVVGLLIFFFDEKKRYDKKILGWAIFSIIFAVGKVKLKLLLHDQHERMIYPLAGWPSLRWSYILSLYAASLSFFVIQLLRAVFFQKKSLALGGTPPFSRYYPAFVMFIQGGLWFILFINFYAVSPRYRLLLCPFLVFCIIYALILVVRKDIFQNRIILVMLTVSFFSTYGIFYKPMEENNHVLLERSLEYRNDLKTNIKMAKELETHFSHLTVSAPFILAQALAFPELGYVQKPLDVMIYGMVCTYGRIKNFCGLRNLNIRRTIWVACKGEAPDEKIFFPGYPAGVNDRVIKEIVVGNKKNTLFMGGTAVDMVWVASQLIHWQAKSGKASPNVAWIMNR